MFLDYVFILRKMKKNEEAVQILNLCLKIRRSFNLARNSIILEQLMEIEQNKKHPCEDSFNLPSPDIILPINRKICLSSDSDSEKMEAKLNEAKAVPKSKIIERKEDKAVNKVLNVFKDLNLEGNSKKTVLIQKKSISINVCSTMIELPKSKTVVKKTLNSVISLSSESDSEKILPNPVPLSKTVSKLVNRVKPVPKSKINSRKEEESKSFDLVTESLSKNMNNVIFPNNVASSTMIAEEEIQVSSEEIEDTPPSPDLLPVRKTARQRKQIENLRLTRITRSKAKK